MTRSQITTPTRSGAGAILYLFSLLGLSLSGCSFGPAPEPSVNPAAAAEAVNDSPATAMDAILRERQAKNEFFRSAASPLPPAARQKFTGLDYYPPDPALRLRLRLNRYDRPQSLRLATNTGEIRSGLVYGFFEFTLAGQKCRLQVYRLDESAGQPALFIPFRDATSGTETYEGGRYIDLTENTTGNYILDFNQAYNPYCAYNPEYSCPAPPRDNTLAIPVRAGEKKYRH